MEFVFDPEQSAHPAPPSPDPTQVRDQGEVVSTWLLECGIWLTVLAGSALIYRLARPATPAEKLRERVLWAANQKQKVY